MRAVGLRGPGRAAAAPSGFLWQSRVAAIERLCSFRYAGRGSAGIDGASEQELGPITERCRRVSIQLGSRGRRIALGIASLLVIGSIPPIVALTAGAGPSSYSLFSGQTGPSRASWGDSHSVEVGVQFSSSVGGTVTALNYWKAAKGTNATRSGHLWDASGRLLASVSFSNDTASGWQQASLSSPVALAPNAMYVVSYFAPWGGYVSTHNYFASSASNGPLSAPSSNNGVFCYSSAPCFPTNTYMASNYWADIVFVASDSTTSSPTVARRSCIRRTI